MVEIIWTEPALNDLDSIAEFIALDKPAAASGLVRRVFAHEDLLTDHPELVSPIRELAANSRYRQIVEAPCRIFYRYNRRERRVYILGVMRGEKLFEKRLLHRRSDPD